MGAHSGKGMQTYERVLSEARVSGKEIGPQYHLHDKQKQEWAKSNKVEAPKKIDSAIAAALKEKITGAVTGTSKTVQKTTKVIAKIVASVKIPVLPTQDELREKLRKERMQKLADSLKASDRTDHIKSVGNGL
jgi:hypothetical protein